MQKSETLDTTHGARISASIIAVLAFAALAVQPLLGDGSYLENLGGMVRFFTIWGNIAACLAMTLAAIGRPLSSGWMAGLVTALTVIGLVYWLLLSADHQPTGYDRITNQFHHTIVPLATVLWWLKLSPPAPRVLPLLPQIMAPPLSYGAFALVLGQATGFYAYFFLDLPALGVGGYVLSNIILAASFAVLGAGLVTLKNAINRSRSPVTADA